MYVHKYVCFVSETAVYDVQDFDVTESYTNTILGHMAIYIVTFI